MFFIHFINKQPRSHGIRKENAMRYLSFPPSFDFIQNEAQIVGFDF